MAGRLTPPSIPVTEQRTRALFSFSLRYVKEHVPPLLGDKVKTTSELARFRCLE